MDRQIPRPGNAFLPSAAPSLAHNLRAEPVLTRAIMRTLIIVTTSATTLFSSAMFAHQPNQSTGSIPDFSGLWSHPYWPGFELPVSGPGPVVNTSRRRQIFDAHDRPLPPANAPFVSDPSRFAGDYANPTFETSGSGSREKNAANQSRAGYPLRPRPTNVGPNLRPTSFRILGC